MRKLFIVLAVLFIIIGAAFVILPMGTLGYLPAGLALVFSVLAFVISDGSARKFPIALLIVTVLVFLAVAVRSSVKDEVAKDDQFEQQKMDSKKEDIKDLEELDDLESTQ